MHKMEWCKFILMLNSVTMDLWSTQKAPAWQTCCSFSFEHLCVKVSWDHQTNLVMATVFKCHVFCANKTAMTIVQEFFSHDGVFTVFVCEKWQESQDAKRRSKCQRSGSNKRRHLFSGEQREMHPFFSRFVKTLPPGKRIESVLHKQHSVECQSSLFRFKEVGAALVVKTTG